MATCVVQSGELPSAGYLVNTYVSTAILGLRIEKRRLKRQYFMIIKSGV